MSFQIAVPFPPLGLSSDVYTGVAILRDDGGIVKVGVAKVPFNRQLTSGFDGSNLEFVVTSDLSTVIGTKLTGTTGTFGEAIADVIRAPVKWSTGITDALTAAGVGEYTVMAELPPYNFGPLLPYVMNGAVALVYGSRPTIVDASINWDGRIVGLTDSGAVIDSHILTGGGAESFYTALALRQNVGGNWAFYYATDSAWRLVGGPVAAGTSAISVASSGPPVVSPSDDRFVGDAEYGLLSWGAGPILLGTNAYRNPNGTFTTYTEEYNPDIDAVVTAIDTYTKSGTTYTPARAATFPNSAQRIVTDLGVPIDTDVFTPWATIPVMASSSVPVATAHYFWGGLVQTGETPEIIVQ